MIRNDGWPRPGAVFALCLLLVTGCSQTRPGPAPDVAVSGRGRGERARLERLARELVARAPLVDASDPKARDAASDRLAGLKELTGAADRAVLWGGYSPDRKIDLEAASLTTFDPRVWVKVYLSTFMFPGPFEVRREGRYDVLDIAAAFRGGLDPGDYPYPFWHTPKKWEAYLRIESLLLIFEEGRWIGTLRKSAPDAKPGTVPPWDGRWRWVESDGSEQPRVALFTYFFSPENPLVPTLDASYRKLESALRAESCTSCHAPDNPSRMARLLLLGYPNQALVGRRELVRTLESNTMPPKNEEEKTPAGIVDDAVRDTLLRLARDFEATADSALAFEDRLSTSARGLH